MKKFTLTIITLTIIIASLILPNREVNVRAETSSVEDVEKSVKTILTSIDELDGVISMTADEKLILTDIFSDLSSVFSVVGSIVTPINGAITFLRIVGAMKDPTASALINIQTQLNDVSEKLTNMDRKLDEIATQMSKLEATEEFHFRATQAQLFRQNWNSFRSTYMEQGLDKLMLQYNSMLADAWKKWFESADNTEPNANSVLIWYSSNGDKSELQNTLMNDFDESKERSAEDDDPYILYANEFDSENDRLISLTGDFFAGAKSISYDVNTYREKLKEYIIQKIKQDLGEEGVTDIKALNINKDMLDDKLLNEIADQAVDMITFKLSNKVINSSSEFSNNVLNQYNLYSDHLRASSEGIDALFRSMYLTHAFEFEIKEDLLNLINLLNLQSGVYSAFVANIIGSSIYISNDDKGKFTTKMCDTLNSLDGYKKSAITGEDRYSYITNTVVDYGRLNIESEASVDWKDVAYLTNYVSCKGGSMQASLFDSNNAKHDVSEIISDSSALLLSYMVRSNGKTLNHDYMNEHLTVNKQSDHGGLVSSYRGEETLTQDSNIRFSTRHIIGSYFENDPDIYLNHLPGDAEYGYVNIHQGAIGTLFDGSTSSLNVNRPLLGIGVYGESHSGWFTDESALMFGPNDLGNIASAVKKDTTYEDTFASYYTTSLYTTIDYNTLIRIPLKDNAAINDENSPINQFGKFMNEESDQFSIHEHVWDEGTIIRDATDDEPGIIEYKCIKEDIENHFYTKLLDNSEMAKLTFDPDGGSLEGFDFELERLFKVGSNITLPSAPEKEGYTFRYWSEADYPADGEYKVTGDKSFKAIWIESVEYLLDEKTEKEWSSDADKAPYIRIIRSKDSDTTLSHFKEVWVDGEKVKDSNYEVSSGSLILKFKTGYLKSLDSGVHLVKVLFDDGEVEFELNIINNAPTKDDKKVYTAPKTGIE